MNRSFWTGPASDPKRYEVTAPTGVPVAEGGGGAEGYVYRARRHDSANDGPPELVALKLLVTVDPESFGPIRDRFAALAAIHHPNLLHVREAFVGTPLRGDNETPASAVSDAAACYVVADWIDGTPLLEAVEAAADSGDDAVGLSLRTVASLADAVDALHSITTQDAPNGFAHRDVKTSNVLLRPDGEAVLIDFGTTRLIDIDDRASLVGTAGFIAPEIAAREEGADPRSGDVYGVGAVAADLLTGHPPALLAGSAAVAQRVRSALGDRPLADEIARHIAALVEVRAGDRPSDLGRWANELRSLAAGTPLASSGSSGRRRLTAAVVILALALVVPVAAWRVMGDDPPASTGSTTTSDSTTAAGGRGAASTTAGPTTTGFACNRSPALPDSPAGHLVADEFAATRSACAGTVEQLMESVGLTLLDNRGNATGALIASTTTPLLHMTNAQYASYRELAGRSQPTNSPLYGGYPAAIRHVDDPGVTVIDLTTGGMLIGRRDDTQSFWIPSQARGLWEAHGGLTGDLGIPTSNVFFTGDRLLLEFERGYMEAIVQGSDTRGSTWLPIDSNNTDVVHVDPTAALAAFGDPRGHVLRQAGGTSWYVDEDRVRHWIATGDVWNCLDAEHISLSGDVPGYAVASLQLGAPATCPGK